MTTILIQPNYSGREALKAIDGCRRLGVDWRWGVLVRPDCVPIGDVEFCERVLLQQGYERPTPDFYPDFLRDWMHRGWTISERFRHYHDGPTGAWFVKSADRYKDYPAKVLRTGDKWPVSGRFIVSEPVTFVQEWRYYVADGEVLASGWYDGNDENEPAPALPIAWPETFSGAVDFGRLADGRIALVESHHPYACGWYGDDSEMWVLWLIEGWRSMLKAQESAPSSDSDEMPSIRGN